jgi:hypothetical protein
MKLRRPRAEEKPFSGYVGDYADKLSRVPAIAHDEDEAPTREDLRYGETLFNRSLVPLPRPFRRGKPPGRR